MSKSKPIHSHVHSNPESPGNSPIADVWQYNFLTELRKLSNLIHDYPIISFVPSFSGLGWPHPSPCFDLSESKPPD